MHDASLTARSTHPTTEAQEASPARLLLLRHAETAAPDRFHGAESDIGLGERGRAQAEAAGVTVEAMQPVAVYCSAMRRARETAEAIGRSCGLEPRIVPELHERVMGSLSGALRVEAHSIYDETRLRWEAGDLDATHPGAESFAQVRDRVVPALTAIAERHRGETVVVVAHGVVIRVLLTSLAEGRSPADFEDIPIHFVGIHTLHYDGRAWREAGHGDFLARRPE